jgi:ankyrin repeat protein
MTLPNDRLEPTLPNLVCNGASVEKIRRRIADANDIDELDFKDWTGLHWALVREVSEVIALLLESGADPNRATGTGRIPLNIAIRSGQSDVVTLLLNAGANADLADIDGNTPLMVARLSKYPELTKLLKK